MPGPLRPFLGKPLIAHGVLHAWEAASVDRVVVATSDVGIAEAAEAYGAEVAWRPEWLGGDSAGVGSAFLDGTDHSSGAGDPRLVVFLAADMPLRRPGEVQSAIETLEREEADSLFSATAVRGRGWRRDAGGLTGLDHDPAIAGDGLDLGESLLENGSIYVVKPWVLRELGSRLGGKMAVHLMDPLDSLPIKEPGDLERLERLAAIREPRATPVGLGRIRLLVLDFDGVMTDNRVWVGQDGTESVACHRGDGMGIGRLKESGVPILVISTETNPVVAARCRKLGLASIQGCDDKLSALRRVAADRDLKPGEIAYVGNDVNDLECLGWVGTPIAVADAVPEVLEVARLVTKSAGGQGAVREVTDWLRAVHVPASSSSLERV